MTKYLGINGLATLVNEIYARFASEYHTHSASDIDGGVLSSYRIPKASSSSLGGVKVGSGLSVTTDGTLSASAPKQVVASASTPTNSDAIIWIKTN